MRIAEVEEKGKERSLGVIRLTTVNRVDVILQESCQDFERARGQRQSNPSGNFISLGIRTTRQG